MLRRITLLALLAVVLIWPVSGAPLAFENSHSDGAPLAFENSHSDGATGSPPSASPPDMTKVSPWVLDATIDDTQTDFLVVLAEQADLSAAYDLPTKQERGRFVRDTLWETAQRSQANLRAWLDAQDVSYRSFYIVNLLYVEAG